MTGRNVHAALTTEVANGKRTLRRGAHIVEEIHLDTVGREDVGHGLGKQPTIVAAVVTNDHREGSLLRKGFLQIVGQSLRSHAHGVDIHSVAAHAHDTAKSARTELQILVKSFDQRTFVVAAHHFFHGSPSLFVKLRSQPMLGFCLALCNQFSVIFHNLLLLKMNVLLESFQFR